MLVLTEFTIASDFSSSSNCLDRASAALLTFPFFGIIVSHKFVQPFLLKNVAKPLFFKMLKASMICPYNELSLEPEALFYN